jgi:hypothetical protein
MRTAPTLILLDGGPSQDTWAAHWLAEAIKARPRPTRDSATRHPCRQAAFFLPGASRPPDVCRLRLVRPRLNHGARDRAAARAFVTTRAGTDTMARSRQETEDEITEADDTAGAAIFGTVRQPAPLVKPADLQTALAPPDDTEFGTKIYENLGLSDFTPAPVTRVGELLGLRSYFMSQLGPRYLWVIKLSLIEWPTLSAQEKKLHAAMRKSFVTFYAFGAEAILQHWLWKTLKNATKSFGPLLKVFATDYDATTTCGTDVWESIFTLFPRSGTAITHQLIVRGFEQCMSIQDDSTATFTNYIARLNESLAQLVTVKPRSLSEIYALAALMGLIFLRLLAMSAPTATL